MTGCAQKEKYIDPRNWVIFVQRGGILAPNVLIDQGAAINAMTRKTMDQIGLVHICPTPIVRELVDRSKIKLEGVLDDVVVSIDSWEYHANFIFLQAKNLVGGHPLILGRPWLATIDAYSRCHFGDMYISHGYYRKKITLDPPGRSI